MLPLDWNNLGNVLLPFVLIIGWAIVLFNCFRYVMKKIRKKSSIIKDNKGRTTVALNSKSHNRTYISTSKKVKGNENIADIIKFFRTFKWYNH